MQIEDIIQAIETGEIGHAVAVASKIAPSLCKHIHDYGTLATRFENNWRFICRCRRKGRPVSIMDLLDLEDSYDRVRRSHGRLSAAIAEVM